jgi:hypothetical protein
MKKSIFSAVALFSALFIIMAFTANVKAQDNNYTNVYVKQHNCTTLQNSAEVELWYNDQVVWGPVLTGPPKYIDGAVAIPTAGRSYGNYTIKVYYPQRSNDCEYATYTYDWEGGSSVTFTLCLSICNHRPK